MIDGLGRYEFISGTSSKFWHIYLDKASNTYMTEWGRIGHPAQGRKGGLSESEALSKIREKSNKGYNLIGGFTSTKKAVNVDFEEPERVSIKSSGVTTKIGKRKLDL